MAVNAMLAFVSIFLIVNFVLIGVELIGPRLPCNETTSGRCVDVSL